MSEIECKEPRVGRGWRSRKYWPCWLIWWLMHHAEPVFSWPTVHWIFMKREPYVFKKRRDDP